MLENRIQAVEARKRRRWWRLIHGVTSSCSMRLVGLRRQLRSVLEKRRQNQSDGDNRAQHRPAIMRHETDGQAACDQYRPKPEEVGGDMHARQEVDDADHDDDELANLLTGE